MKRSKYEHFTLPFRFFAPSVFILLGSLLAGIFAYHKTSELVESEAMKNNLAVLNQTRSILDRRFSEIEMIAHQLANDTKVVSFQHVREPYSGTNPYKLLLTEKALLDYRLTNHFLIDYFLVFKKSDMVISPSKVYGLRQFYEMQFNYENMTAEEWSASILNGYHYRTYIPAQRAVYEKKQYSVVSYVQSFGNRSLYGGAVVVMIDNDQIQALLRELDIQQGGFAYIADQEGRIISYVSSDPEFVPEPMVAQGAAPHAELIMNGQKMLVTQTTSSFNGWTFVSAQPLQVVLQKVNYLKQLTWVIFITALIVGLLIAGFFAYRHSRPWQRLLGALALPQPLDQDAPLPKNPMDVIQHSVMRLIHNNELLQERLEKQLPMLKNAFFDRLLKGQFHARRDIEVTMSHLGIQWNHRFSVVAILHVNTYAGDYSEDVLMELDIKKLAIHELIQKAYSRSIFTQDMDVNKIALLMNIDAETADACKAKLRSQLLDLHHQLTSNFHIRAWMVIGGEVEDIVDISRSYEEASLAANYGGWNEDCPVIFQHELSMQLETYYFPTDVETRLLNLVKSGNQSETKKLLEHIEEKNEERQLSYAMKKMLVHELSAALLKCCDMLGMEKGGLAAELELSIKMMEQMQPPEEALENLSAAFCQVTQKIDCRKKSHNDELKDEMLKYIVDNYMRSELSLSMLSTVFQTSEAYISYFFKEQTGENFSEYVEKVRMSKAKSLLTDSELSINEIANWVGYYSLNTFSRAFKRANGMSATQYRRSMQP
ncbi:helix-turn-helix domain-containing protein [Paenibacillus sp. IITD108]|uniref:helix-turn-helix domain-containing protein n=1 Tax=Paenibacillus sp. IITD108 TaxID=3116649 RepID=UPI002F40A9D7